MENWKDGHFHGAFAVISSLEPVEAATQGAVARIIAFGLAVGVLLVIGAFYFIRGPISSLQSVSKELEDSASQVGSASEQLSKAGHEVSSGSTESASALEETVASVEELASMVKLNADNAGQAAVLAKESQTTATEGEQQMIRLLGAMNEISASSKKIEEIINVIDEISFQTNLLALNAAVEAARAGEHGKGFAVVADAVRSLAQRSATAAKDINGLIKDSLTKIQSGNEIAQGGGEALKKIVTAVVKVSDLNSEIARASTEQSNGLEQITKAMNELDSSTQQNASASEEVAASAEEMSAQARVLDSLVSSLNGVINGEVPVKGTSGGSHPSVMAHQSKTPSKGLSKLKLVKADKRKSAPSMEDVFPMEDSEPAKKKAAGFEGF